MNLETRRAQLLAADALIRRDQSEIAAQRLLLARLAALGQTVAAAADILSTMEATLQHHCQHRQSIVDAMQTLEEREEKH